MTEIENPSWACCDWTRRAMIAERENAELREKLKNAERFSSEYADFARQCSRTRHETEIRNTRLRDQVAQLKCELEIFRSYGERQPCGHPQACIVSSDDRAHYCGWCEDIADAKRFSAMWKERAKAHRDGEKSLYNESAYQRERAERAESDRARMYDALDTLGGIDWSMTDVGKKFPNMTKFIVEAMGLLDGNEDITNATH